MTFLYFAYGSNMWPPQLCSRCASARLVSRATVRGWKVVYDKPGADGTAKANLRESPGCEIHGVLYELDESDRSALDAAEPGYTPIRVEVTLDDARVLDALTYRWEPSGTDVAPADWYVSLVTSGAAHHRLPEAYVSSALKPESSPQPGVAALTPAGASDLTAMQEILASALASGAARYTIHPRDLAWWVWHDDPRFPDRVSYWMIPGEVVLVIDARNSEVGVFTSPGRARVPVIEWAQRRLRGSAVLGWVADNDEEMVHYLEDDGYEPGHVDRLYHWDLGQVEVPEPALPAGWQLRPLAGEQEADERRRASHAAFGSTMDPAMHLERYLRFMRSPVYDHSRDLVAVSPEGRIAAFMIWWPDSSGIAQIEPFGTHPGFQGRGVGRALMYHGLHQMSGAGMRLARVTTDGHREDANSFYQSVGFEGVGRLRWWRREP